MKIRLLLPLLLASALSVSAHAKVHVYEFTASVSSMQWGNTTPEKMDSWVPGSALSLGDTINGRFSFDDAPLQNYVPPDPAEYSAGGSGLGNAISVEVSPNRQSVDTAGMAGSLFASNSVQGANAFVQIAHFSDDVTVYVNFEGGRPGQFSDASIPFNLSLSSYPSGSVVFFWDTPETAYIAAVGTIDSLTNVTPVPEPSVYLMLGAGLAVVGAGVRRRRKNVLHA